MSTSYFPSFQMIIFLGLCYILTYVLGSNGTVKYQQILSRSVVILLTITQLHFLLHACKKIPYNYTQNAYRWDCLLSEKGGKVKWNNEFSSRNPCYCDIKKEGGKEVENTFNITANRSRKEEFCLNGNKDASTYNPFLDNARDCSDASRSECTANHPCTPCSLSRREEFGIKWKRCRSCTKQQERKCGFVEGRGPYCFKSVTSRDVVPCEICCTDPFPIFDSNGTCY